MVDEVVEAAGVHAVGDGVFDKVVVEAAVVDAVVDGMVDEVVPTLVRCYFRRIGHRLIGGCRRIGHRFIGCCTSSFISPRQ